MKKLAAITFTSMMLLLATAMTVGAVDSVEIRGEVHDLGEVNDASWDNSTFAGFYYDIDDNLGMETITFHPTDIKDGSTATLDDDKVDGVYGVTYTSTAQDKEFDFEDWGFFKVIGFMSDKYFAGYSDRLPEHGYDAVLNPVAFLADKTKNDNLLKDEQLSKVLLDDDTERTFTSGTPLKLEEGYELSIKSIDIDGNKVYVELSKDGSVIDSKVVSPSKDSASMSDKTYYYKKDLGDSSDVVVVAVHFKNAFRGSDTNLATVDGVWQISDTPASVESGTDYDKMTLESPTEDQITATNKDNQISLGKNKDIVLMGDIHIKTADSDVVNTDNPLRYYIYKSITEPGTYDVRGAVKDLGADDASWDNSTFAGFYYDIDDNLGMEQIDFHLTDKKIDAGTATLDDDKVDGVYGVTYTSTAQDKEFDFEDWGFFKVIGFMSDKYFAGYSDRLPEHGYDAVLNPVAFLADKTKNDNLLKDEQLSKVLLDDDTEKTFTSGTPLKLEEGYELSIKSIDIDGNKVYVELSKDGSVIDSKVISPSKEDATMSDKTYYYKKDLGDSSDVVVVAVHFKNAFRGSDTNLATVDGVWQISDAPASVESGTDYDKMTLESPTEDQITATNKDNQISLGKNKDIVLMGEIHIKTADQDVISADSPLRYYICKEATIEGASETTGATPEVPAVTEEKPEVVATPEPVVAEENNTTTEAVAEPAATNETPAKTTEEAAKPAENKTEPSPGFESVFAITGLLAVAYLVLGRRE